MASTTSSTSESEARGLGRATEFLRNSWAELHKVSFPTKQETIQATTVVLIITIVVSLFLFVVDQIFSTLMKSLIS